MASLGDFKSRNRPIAMRQAAVQSPSALQEIYTSETATLNRSKSRIQMILHDDQPIRRPSGNSEREHLNSAGHQCVPEICEMAEKLKVQVADLSLFLEEERMLHKDTKRRATEILKDQQISLKNDHKAALRRQQAEHEADMEALKTQHHVLLVNERLEFNNTIAKLKTELEIMTGAFHTFKTQTEISRKAELKECEARVTSALKTEKENEKRDLENLLNYEHNQEVRRLEQSHQKKLTDMKQEYKKQADALKKRFVGHEDDLYELKVLREKLEITSAELKETKAQVSSYEQELFDMKMKYSDSKVLLANNEHQIDDRIKEIETKYKKQHDSLLEANTMLRMQYLKKCEELFELNASTKVDSIQKADEVMSKANAKKQKSSRSK